MMTTETGMDLSAMPTVSDLILKSLRDRIISNTLAEGEPIRQDEIAQQFNVSKIPVREALKRLEAEGFVTFHRNRGAVVASLTAPELSELFEIRALLESTAIRYAIPAMTEADLDIARAAQDAFASSTNVSEWADLNQVFHCSLYGPANRPQLLAMITGINNRLGRYLRVQLTISGGHARATQEHSEIFAACLARDAETAAALTTAHILNAYHSLDAGIEHQGA